MKFYSIANSIDYRNLTINALGIFFLCISLLSLTAPLIQSLNGYPSGEGLYSFLSPICHQYPTRSLWIMERPFALCTRCFSGYLGLGIGMIFIRPNYFYFRRLLIGMLLLLPGVLDGVIQLLTDYESNNFTRAFTGLVAGVGLYFILCPFKIKKQNQT